MRPLHLLYVLVAMHPWVAVRAQRTAVERCMTRAVYADDFVTHPPPGYPHVEGGGVESAGEGEGTSKTSCQFFQLRIIFESEDVASRACSIRAPAATSQGTNPASRELWGWLTQNLSSSSAIRLWPPLLEAAESPATHAPSPRQDHHPTRTGTEPEAMADALMEAKDNGGWVEVPEAQPFEARALFIHVRNAPETLAISPTSPPSVPSIFTSASSDGGAASSSTSSSVEPTCRCVPCPLVFARSLAPVSPKLVSWTCGGLNEDSCHPLEWVWVHAWLYHMPTYHPHRD